MTPTFFIVLTITVAISAFLIFQIIYNLHRQKKTEKLRAAFKKAAAEFNLSISKSEISGNRAIGFDAISNKLLYMQLTGHKQDGYLVDLEEVKSCKVKRTYTPFWNGWTISGVLVQKIALQLNYRKVAKPLRLTFYDNWMDPASETEEKAKLAARWQTFLATRPYIKRATKNKTSPLRPLLHLPRLFHRAGE